MQRTKEEQEKADADRKAWDAEEAERRGLREQVAKQQAKQPQLTGAHKGLYDIYEEKKKADNVYACQMLKKDSSIAAQRDLEDYFTAVCVGQGEKYGETTVAAALRGISKAKQQGQTRPGPRSAGPDDFYSRGR